jgi:predicted nucleic acid-binding protein
VIVFDTSVMYALLDARDRRHPECAAWYETVREEIATTPLVLAEVDHLTATRAGERALRAFRADLNAGAYAVEWWANALSECVELAEQYADLGLSLADASLVALAARVETTRIATLDERHFRTLRPVSGESAFRLLPVDAG